MKLLLHPCGLGTYLRYRRVKLKNILQCILLYYLYNMEKFQQERDLPRIVDSPMGKTFFKDMGHLVSHFDFKSVIVGILSSS